MFAEFLPHEPVIQPHVKAIGSEVRMALYGRAPNLPFVSAALRAAKPHLFDVRYGWMVLPSLLLAGAPGAHNHRLVGERRLRIGRIIPGSSYLLALNN